MRNRYKKKEKRIIAGGAKYCEWKHKSNSNKKSSSSTRQSKEAAAEEEAGIEAQAEEEEEGEAKRAEQLRENVGKVEKPFIPQCLQSPLPIELFPPTASGQGAEEGGGQGGG